MMNKIYEFISENHNHTHNLFSCLYFYSARHNSSLGNEIRNLSHQPNGKYAILYENGKPYLEEFYRDGKLEGERRIWYRNGKIWHRSYYRNGKLEGKCEAWHADGSIKARELYMNAICLDRRFGRTNLIAKCSRSYRLGHKCMLESFLIADLAATISNF